MTAEYEILQKGLGWILLSHPVLRFEGPDWRECLQGALSNDIKNLLKVGQGLAACHLTPKGKLAAALKLFQIDDKGAFVFTSPPEAENLKNHIKNLLLFSQTELKDVSDAWAWLFGIGQEALRFAHENWEIGETLPPLGHQPIQIGGVRAEFIKEKGWLYPAFLLLIPRHELSTTFERLQNTPAPFPIRKISPETLEILRIESGIPFFGRDMDDNTLPQEALPEEDFISYSKGCYVGQETVSRVHHLGHVNKNLVRLVLENKVPPPVGSAIFWEGKEVGNISSSALSPRLEKSVALATVRREAAEAGSKLLIKTENENIQGIVI